jgi:hypothetical protein
VVRGAAAKGLEGDGRAAIKNRKCRRHYGSECMPVFVPGKHLESEARICNYTGIKRADNQVEWLLKKGQDLATDTKSHTKCAFLNFFWPGNSRVSQMDLLACDAEKAPQRAKDKVYAPTP